MIWACTTSMPMVYPQTRTQSKSKHLISQLPTNPDLVPWLRVAESVG